MRIPVLFSALLGLGLLFLLAPAHTARAASTCLVVADAASGATIKREGDCGVRRAPMSTFKVALALMGFDAGILTGPLTPRLDYKPEYDAPDWARKPTDPTIWLRDSIVWYSQQLTKKLGMERFQHYADAFDYGNRDVSGAPGKHDGLMRAWLATSLQISPDEQVRFLRKLVLRQLPVSAHAYDMTERSVAVFETDGWTVHGKTGGGWAQDETGAILRNRPLGWFVGWAEKDGRTIVFARNAVLDGPSDTPPSFKVRDALLADLPAVMAGR